MRHIFILVTVFIVQFTLAQNPVNFQNVRPPSPEVATITKNVDIPMSYTSGTPQIGVPLYTAKSGSIEVPIALSYNASGIRVEEAATWVGLGWNLNTGPTLTRSVRGLADDTNYGYINSGTQRKVKYIYTLPSTSLDRETVELSEYPNKQVDIEPDIFSFSALGFSGQFYWNQDSSKFIISPYQPIIIEYSGNTGISFFKLTLPNGIKVIYGTADYSRERSLGTITTSVVNGNSQSPDESASDDVTSWGISEIIDPRNKRMNFYYTMDYDVEEFGRGGEVLKTEWVENQPDILVRRNSYYEQTFIKPILYKIVADNCQVYFKRSSAIRQDVANYGKSLDTISIHNHNDLEIKSFILKYVYTTSSDLIELPGIEEFANVARKRLMLTEVEENHLGSGLKFPPYKFFYNSIPLPSRLSSSQDYWGYYNGKANTQDLMPRIPQKIIIPNVPNYSLPNGYKSGIGQADRRIDSSFSKAGSLEMIKYPTGGVTRYEYEPNSSIVNMYWNHNSVVERPDLIEKSYTFSPMLSIDPPYPAYYMDTFRVKSALTSVKVQANLPSPCNPTTIDPSCLYTIKIYSLPDTTLLEAIIETTGEHTYELPPSLYRIEAFYTGSPSVQVNFAVNLSWGEARDTMNFWVGGLRVKKIVNEDMGGNKISRSFKYNMPESGYSSGILAGFPVHIINTYNSSQNITGFEFNSSSAVPLSTDGQTVRYMAVEEFFDSLQTSFKNQYLFYCDIPNVSASPRDGVPIPTKSWMNNILLNKKILEKNNNSYRPVMEEWNYHYLFHETTELVGLNSRQFRPYYYHNGYFLPNQSTQTTYSYEGSQSSTISQVTDYDYNERFMLATSRTTNSKGQVIDQRTWYPDNYNNVSGYNLAELKQKNIITIPIKQEVSINGKIRSGSIVKYSVDGLPEEIYSYENGLEDTVIHSNNTILETGYVLKGKAYYDYARNIRQVNPNNNNSTSYLWYQQNDPYTAFYTNAYPIALVENADSLSIAFTSFETEQNGNWTYSGTTSSSAYVTGRVAYNLASGNISKTGLSSSANYVVSYWSTGVQTVSNSASYFTGRSFNGLNYYEHKVVNPTGGSVSISGSGYIDELRLYPEKAQMVSYAYDNNDRITSICDANNMVNYYTYDVWGRLFFVKDLEGNIIKKYCYNYQGQTENCDFTYYSAPQSANFTKNNCSSGTGSTVTYKVKGGTYTSTVSQEAANSLAAADVAANGQAYANSTGTCN